MKYVNADVVFPEELLKEIRKYVKGGLVYIPSPEGDRKKWGENSGSRAYMVERNDGIRRAFAAGETLDQLSDHYCLSPESIKKIVYAKK
ncbi:CD3324 family protein [Paenibacillus sacheonensis]|uniref:Mor transcription activator domain-containing protein n=1 Tax=Paenibacillus sacheonensis TaxID=742054 RepID=A0A7X4YLR1_9BACL|nr:CD3324 family protein [Paenibacillus sacheonensis]MBM7566006.1 Mor family transcriptional regulator [Paenibacillus sacheonensis]NBC68681.1 hypothetical protein [Paenibacillus sacheonensis]